MAMVGMVASTSFTYHKPRFAAVFRKNKDWRDRGFLHFYHYNELHSSNYHYYDATYIYTIREKFDLQIYHIRGCGSHETGPRWR